MQNCTQNWFRGIACNKTKTELREIHSQCLVKLLSRVLSHRHLATNSKDSDKLRYENFS